MKVLLIADLLSPYVGGIEVLADRVVPALQDRGFEFSILTGHHYLDLPETGSLGDAPVLRLPCRSTIESGDPFEILRLRSQVKRHVADFSPDLVHHFSTGPITFFVDTAGLPVITSLQQRIQDNCKQPESLIYRTLDRSDWITTCSAALIDQVASFLPHKKSVCSAVLNSIPLPDVEPVPLPSDELNLLALGRLTDQKGLDVAVRAMPEILSSFPNTRLVFAGDGPLREPLTALAAELGVAEKVEFLGTVDRDRLIDVFNSSSMLVMPSRWEGLPVAAVEAAAMARPIVSTAVDGLPEIVLDGETGLLIESESPSSMAAAVTRLAGDPDWAREMGRRGRQHATTHFALSTCVDGYEAAYRRFDLAAERKVSEL